MSSVNVKPIRSDQDLMDALSQFERVMFAEPGTADHDLMDVLGAQIRVYEAIKHPVEYPDPIEAIKEAMSQRQMTPVDLRKIIGGGSGRAYEILGRKRPLTLAMIRKISSELRIPAEVLIQPIRLAS